MILDARLTVVIPTFNRARMVEQAVESVLAQTLQPVEVIVVDDGSTDDTRQRLARFESISYVRQEHGGPGRARNTGMRLARGEYVAFLDSDDSFYPYKLELQARVLEAFPDVAMTYSECSAFDDAGLDDVWHLRTYHESAFRGAPAGYDHLFETSLDLEATGLLRGLPIAPALTAGRRAYFGNIFDVYLQRTIVFTNSMMFRRAVLAEVGFQNESLRLFEDLDFALRLCRRHKVCFVDVPTYRLRYHHGQVSSMRNANRIYVWIRKQQMLLHVTRRHALANPAGDARTEASVNERIAHLHRAVAVPLMLYDGGTAATRKRFAERARKYLAKCAQLGHQELGLWGLSHLPGPLRRLGVTLVERRRRAVQ